MTAADLPSALQNAVGYDAVRDMMIRLARVPSPQTELMEAEPRILAFIREVVEPELRAAGVSDIRSTGRRCLSTPNGDSVSANRSDRSSSDPSSPRDTARPSDWIHAPVCASDTLTR